MREELKEIWGEAYCFMVELPHNLPRWYRVLWIWCFKWLSFGWLYDAVRGDRKE